MAATATRRSSAAEAAAEHDKPLSRRVLVTIRRDQTTQTPRAVWLHEVPILQLIWGEDEVREVEPATLDEGYSAKLGPDMTPHNKRQDEILPPSLTTGLGWVFTGDPQAEFQRLAEAYGRHAEVNQPNVEFVYGRFSTGRFRSIVGRPTLADLPDGQLRDLILSHGHTLPVATQDSTATERDEAAKAWAAFRCAGRTELLTLAESVGVELG